MILSGNVLGTGDKVVPWLSDGVRVGLPSIGPLLALSSVNVNLVIEPILNLLWVDVGPRDFGKIW